MTDRDRRTSWRQGQVMTDEAAIELELISVTDKGKVITMVISHDCDIVQNKDVEPEVEVIVGRRLITLDGNYTHAKNPRKLHLSAKENDSPVFFELLAKSKKLIQKDKLFAFKANSTIMLLPRDFSVLQRWLAARYHRSAFPDEFQRPLQNAGLNRRLLKICEPLGDHLIAIYFDIDDRKSLNEEGSDDPYKLTIILLYSTEKDLLAAEQAAEGAAALIVKTFRESFFDHEKNIWREIELLECLTIADQAMSYAMSRQLKKWPLVK